MNINPEEKTVSEIYWFSNVDATEVLNEINQKKSGFDSVADDVAVIKAKGSKEALHQLQADLLKRGYRKIK